MIEQIAEADDVEIDITDDTVSIGSVLDVPDGLTILLPAGGEMTTAGSDASYVFAAVRYSTDRFDEIVSSYKGWTSSDSREWNLSESTTEMSGDTIRDAQWQSGPSAISVNDCATSSGEVDAVCVTVNESS